MERFGIDGRVQLLGTPAEEDGGLRQHPGFRERILASI